MFAKKKSRKIKQTNELKRKEKEINLDNIWLINNTYIN